LSCSDSQLNVNGDSTKLLAAILCAALYPNVVKVLTPEKSYANSVMGAIPQNFRAGELEFKTRDDGYVSNATTRDPKCTPGIGTSEYALLK
jgi:ATP-dependent RNA helicase DHX57